MSSVQLYKAIRSMCTPMYLRSLKYLRYASSMKHSSFSNEDLIHDLDGSPVKPGALVDTLRLPHPVYTRDQLEKEKSGHHVPTDKRTWLAHKAVLTLRSFYDLFSGYSLGFINEQTLLTRVIILETVAGIPGIVGAAIRHLKSLRKIERDYGWIHSLLEEAENERMHLMCTMYLKNPNAFTRFLIAFGQMGFLSFYTLAYSISPYFCHRFVGYLEEEAFKTYSHILHEIDQGNLPGFETPAPKGTIEYWKLPKDATLRDVFLAIRADENHHRVLNHVLASLKPTDINPFPPGF